MWRYGRRSTNIGSVCCDFLLINYPFPSRYLRGGGTIKEEKSSSSCFCRSPRSSGEASRGDSWSLCQWLVPLSRYWSKAHPLTGTEYLCPPRPLPNCEAAFSPLGRSIGGFWGKATDINEKMIILEVGSSRMGEGRRPRRQWNGCRRRSRHRLWRQIMVKPRRK